MAQQIINYGNTANDGTGDPLRDAFIKVDENFDQIWAAGPVGSNITIQNNTIAATDTNGNIILSPNGVGIIQTNRPLYPRIDNAYDLGTGNLRYRSAFIGAGGLSIDGNITLANIANLQIPGGTNGYVIQTDGAGNLSWTAQTGTGNGNPGGADTQVQYNNGGLFGGSTAFTFDDVANALTVAGNISGNYILGNGSALTGIQPGGVTQANVPPPNPTANTLWWDEITGRLYVWYTDTDGSQWVDAAPAGSSSAYGNSNVSSYLSSSLVGNIVPSGNAVYSLGDSSNQWKNLYAANVSASANISAEYFIGDGSLLTNVGGADNKIYNGTSYANIDSPSGNLEININNNSWIFDSEGNLTVPFDTNINTPDMPYADINFHVAQGGMVRIQGGSGGLGALLALESNEINSLNRIEIDTFGNNGLLGGTFLGSFSRGEPGSYEAVQAGDRLAGLRGRGYDGSSFITTGLISIDAFDNWAVGNTPTKISFLNDTYNNASPVLNMEINPDGNVNIFNGNIIVTGGGGYLQGNDITGSGGLYAGIPEFTPLGSEVVAQFAANINSYSQINFQNISNGAHSSTDAVLTADNGTDTTHFVNLGIAGSNWDGTQPNSLGNDIGPGDGYLYVQDGDLVLGSLNGGTSQTWNFGADGTLTAPGNVTVTGNLNVTGTAGNVATKFSGSWTVPTGNSTQSFSVEGNNTYQMWVEGNIPNGIIAWNALVTVTNNNVPVLGQQFAWNYEGGGSPLLLTTIPDQIIGTAGAISNVAPVVANTNVFTFGINNASGSSQTVQYGWIRIS
jgi:hypothetical protein